MHLGLPWWSSGQVSVLPLQGAQVRCLVRELRSHTPSSAAKKKQKKCINVIHFINYSKEEIHMIISKDLFFNAIEFDILETSLRKNFKHT